MKKLVALCLVLASAPLLAAEELNFEEASRIAIQAGGRKKPLETFAAESLQTISGRRTIKDPESGQPLKAIDALFSIWFGTRKWDKADAVLVPNAVLRQRLNLTARSRLFSLATLQHNSTLRELTGQIRSKYQRQEELTPLEKEIEAVWARMDLLQRLMTGEALTIVPNPQNEKAAWTTLAGAKQLYGDEKHRQLVAAFETVSGVYRRADTVAFSRASGQLRDTLTQLAPEFYPSAKRLERELQYNRVHPFRLAWVFYLAAFFVLLAARVRPFGLVLFGFGFALQVYGFVLRCLIAGYAPVTNMYESVVWVSLGVAGFALVFDVLQRTRIYTLTAAPIAVLGLILADQFPSVLNPNIGPLPPVLRDNFWLVTHVLTITLGYAAFALAMGLGHVVLAAYSFTRRGMTEQSPLHQLLYRVLQIGVFLLAVGTILGGVWANYSWGRFWGWDPKETWALIALLLYIFALHGRIAGWWGNFGLSVAAAVCFNGVLMAWYGVNFVLGKGLHSYGFGGGGGYWIGGLILLDLLFVGYCTFKRIRSMRRSVSLAPSETGPARALKGSGA